MLGFKFPKEYRILLAEHMILVETGTILVLTATNVLTSEQGEAQAEKRVSKILSSLELTEDDVKDILEGR